MESKLSHSGHGRPQMCRKLFSVALAAALLLPAPGHARDLLQPVNGLLPAELVRVNTQTCQLLCGRELSECERERKRGIHCPRDFQQCKQGCEPARRPELTPAQQKTRICTQRCETMSAQCEQEVSGNDESCRTGMSQCVKRC